MTWWHGGPRILGDMVLPACETGATPLDSDPSGEWVYVTNSPGAALLYASAHRNGWIYEVEPVGELDDDPDLRDGPSGVSKRCRSARIVKRLKPSNRSIEMARCVMVTP